MKLLELSNNYKVYVDLDGVLVDFDRQAVEMLGMSPPRSDISASKQQKKQFWDAVTKLYDDGKQFWRNMHPTKDCDKLWSYVKKYDPTILSSRGGYKQATKEKQEWVDDQLGDDVPTIIVDRSNIKAKYATPMSILIDDTPEVIELWTKQGGIGILHKNANDTIQQLKKLGL